MSLSLEDVNKIAALARIHIGDEERDALVGELNNIIDWVEMLSEVGTDGVAPMTTVADMQVLMREDLVSDGDSSENVLGNAPDRQGDFYAVPKVVV
ncbi:MAG: aspartyl/glutamyl-tRNA(Asn/Gln) amidotransferase subunit C [Rhodospirillaceae bacterium TMED8]|mgnify:CR=1 FL=1|nr:Asp-tRNA(Asn)/Glu-tRNA(Gln) amidotransferase GatCAB subunit C [Magnetovibrio sp.]OUT48883.1 MAG: aspartyl/glutamyl-tRNA(Asn/Gln) amidotransferase subunit C [Rhodospirillaceae bacterium TMED8]|tara:strand:+ start:1604 stop:1891 length:288 start_codon:yes stop_codon:yes gene_type:complete